MKPKATFDSSFWVHAAYLDLLGFLFLDYYLHCTSAVEKEMGEETPTSLLLRSGLRDGRIKQVETRKEWIQLYGKGERAAINVAIERKLILLIDDWKPYQAALEAGVEVVNTPIYVIRLNRQNRLTDEQTLECCTRLLKRRTIKPEWISAAMEIIALQRKERKG